MFEKTSGGWRSDAGFHAAPKLPIGRMETFKKYDVRLLRDFDCDEEGDKGFKKGTVVEAMAMPTGKVYLTQGVTFETDAVAGKDFEFVETNS
jgi:hypothetical protein